MKQWYVAMLVVAMIGAITWVVAFAGYQLANWDQIALDVALYGLCAVGVAFLGAIIPAAIWWFSTTKKLRENIQPPPH